MQAWTLEYFEQAIIDRKQELEEHNKSACKYGCNGLARCDRQRSMQYSYDLMCYRRDYIKKHGSTAGMLADMSIPI